MGEVHGVLELYLDVEGFSFWLAMEVTMNDDTILFKSSDLLVLMPYLTSPAACALKSCSNCSLVPCYSQSLGTARWLDWQ
jgi:hypothetical protein